MVGTDTIILYTPCTKKNIIFDFHSSELKSSFGSIIPHLLMTLFVNWCIPFFLSLAKYLQIYVSPSNKAYNNECTWQRWQVLDLLSVYQQIKSQLPPGKLPATGDTWWMATLLGLTRSLCHLEVLRCWGSVPTFNICHC